MRGRYDHHAMERPPRRRGREIWRLGVSGGGTSSSSSFVAVIKSAGPEEEADFTDGRYWVCEQEDSADASDPPSYADKSGGRYVQAFNRLEAGIGGSGNGIHCLNKSFTGLTAPTRYVTVWTEMAADGPRYVFESPIGQYFAGQLALLNVCQGGDGCTGGEWFSTTGTAITATSSDPSACS